MNVHDFQTSVACEIAKISEAAWESEETLQGYLNQKHPLMDYKTNGNVLVRMILKDAIDRVNTDEFKINPSHADMTEVFIHLASMIDANLWSQLYLNSELFTSPIYNIAKMSSDLDNLRKSFEGSESSPFAVKAKMLPESGPSDEATTNWNRSLALARGIKAGVVRPTHYRMYPFGSTPAFTDTENVSMLNSKYVDPYIVWTGSLNLSIIYYEQMPPVEITEVAPGQFTSDEFKGTFISKSGDIEGLRKSLVTRKCLRSKFLSSRGQTRMVPRWGSLTILA